MMTVSAAVSVMPWPPARVDSRKAKPSDPSAPCHAHLHLQRHSRGEAWTSECATHDCRARSMQLTERSRLHDIVLGT